MSAIPSSPSSAPQRPARSRRDIFFGPSRFRLPWILIAIALIASIPWALLRWRFENNFTNAQITVDYNDTRSLSDAYGVTQKSLLEDLRDRGVRSVAVYQQTIFSLRDLGRLSLTPRETAERLYPDIAWDTIPPGYRYLMTFMRNASDLQNQVEKHLAPQSKILPMRVVELGVPSSRVGGATGDLSPRGILVPASAQILSDASMGFDPSHLALVRQAGLTPTARISNTLNLTLPRAEQSLDEAKATGAKVVLFSEDEVLGYNTLLPLVAKATRERGLLFGTIEFSKQRGNEEFAKASDGLLARVHSVNGDEAAKLQKAALLDRYVRAIKERDIRVAYIRLFRQFKGEYEMPSGGLLARLRGGGAPADAQPTFVKDARQQNLDLVQDIADELQRPPVPALPFLRPGYKMDLTTGFGTDVNGKFLSFPNNYLQPTLGEKGTKVFLILARFLVGLGVVGSVLLMLHLFFDLSPRAARNWLVAGLMLAFLCSLSGGIGARLLALGAGVPFSFVGVMWGGLPELWDRGRTSNGEPRWGQTVKLAFSVLIRTTLLTIIGGFLIVAFMDSWVYMSKADEFLGEKATLTVPILLAALAFAGEAFPHRVAVEGAAAARQRAFTRFRNVASRPFSIEVAMGLGALALVGYVYIARTGNESGMEISPVELALRATLEKVFLTRPRTKEIFVANPAIMFAAYFMLRRWWLPALFATIAVAMGQSDVVNTMCHIHTPIFFCIWRTITGVLIGGAIGAVALWFWIKIEGRLLGSGRLQAMFSRGSGGSNSVVDDVLETPYEGTHNGLTSTVASRVGS